MRLPRRAIRREAVQEHDRLATGRAAVVDVEGQPVAGEGLEPRSVRGHPPIMAGS